MPVPLIVPVAAALAAGAAVGFLVGRETAPVSVDCEDYYEDEHEDGHEDGFEADPAEEEQAGRSGSEAPAPAGMTEAEALDILGLDAGAAPDDIREAHRRLSRHLRPDKDGSGHLAGLVERAGDVLLAQLA